MAALRFTIRTYALEGYWPTAILDKCSKQLHVLADGHFATVLVGMGDVRRREITLANAGHLNPLVIDGERTSFIECRVGVPLGVPGGTYESVTVAMPTVFDADRLHRWSCREPRRKPGRGTEALGGISPRGGAPAGPSPREGDHRSHRRDVEDDIAMLGLRWKS